MITWQQPTLVDYALPRTRSLFGSLLKDALLIVAFSLVLALSAQVAVYLPWISPVPFTLQTLAVVLTGAALGSKRGLSALVLYYLEGGFGLPFFAKGASGWAVFVGPTAGYLVGFALAAYLVGYLCEKKQYERNFLTSFLVTIPASVIILSLGFLWIGATYFQGNWSLALTSGLLPFIPGDLVKQATAILLLPAVWALVKKMKPEAFRAEDKPE